MRHHAPFRSKSRQLKNGAMSFDATKLVDTWSQLEGSSFFPNLLLLKGFLGFFYSVFIAWFCELLVSFGFLALLKGLWDFFFKYCSGALKQILGYYYLSKQKCKVAKWQKTFQPPYPQHPPNPEKNKTKPWVTFGVFFYPYLAMFFCERSTETIGSFAKNPRKQMEKTTVFIPWPSHLVF